MLIAAATLERGVFPGLPAPDRERRDRAPHGERDPAQVPAGRRRQRQGHRRHRREVQGRERPRTGSALGRWDTSRRAGVVIGGQIHHSGLNV